MVDDIIYDIYEPVKESYFGKTKELLKAEKILSDLYKYFKVDKYKSSYANKISITKLSRTITNSKFNKDLEVCFEKQFGFRQCTLIWDPGMDLQSGILGWFSINPNLYTMPSGILVDMSGTKPFLPVKQSDGGYYDAKHNHHCVVVIHTIDLIDLDPSELLATILHEIGHNFQCTPLTHVVQLISEINAFTLFIAGLTTMKSNSPNAAIQGMSLIIDGIASTTFGKEYVVPILWKIKAEASEVLLAGIFPILESIYAAIDSCVDTLKKAGIINVGIILELAKLFSNGINPVVAGFGQLGYSGEVFADSFATAYGYGPETISAQKKFLLRKDNPEYEILYSDKSLASTLNNFIHIITMLTFTLFDPHPMPQTRMKNQIDHLKDDLSKSNLPPDLKKKMKKDLFDCEKRYNDFLNLSDKGRNYVVISSFSKLNEKLFDGKLEFRNFLNKIINLGIYRA